MRHRRLLVHVECHGRDVREQLSSCVTVLERLGVRVDVAQIHG